MAHKIGTDHLVPYTKHIKQTHRMIYTVSCPKLNETEVCYSQEHAIDVCYSMHVESKSYAFVEDYLGWTVAEYGDILDGITNELSFC